jgi:RNA-splicing ligase RtcB
VREGEIPVPREVAPGVLSWASEIDEGTVQQAARAARMPFVAGHVALMPDAHVGIGATVGSVIPTAGAIIPAAVGVDIGCGMVASLTTLTATDLPDDLDQLMPLVQQRIPAGVGRAHQEPKYGFNRTHLSGIPAGDPGPGGLTAKQRATVAAQFGTLGSGNHFVEVCLDSTDRVWTVLHSGSRGIGNQLAQLHMKVAKGLMKDWFIQLEDPDLAYLTQGTPQFDAYISDMLWSQDYAMASRQRMNAAITTSRFEIAGHGGVEKVVNCHHNFTQREHHQGKDLWITRKGAIKAAAGDWGVIPGSMGTRSYVVSGNGVESSYTSCSHGAGRRMSRSAAKRDLTPESLRRAMTGKVWNSDRADILVDEHPAAYKEIERVMEDQKDLVTVEAVLRQIFNYKG